MSWPRTIRGVPLFNEVSGDMWRYKANACVLSAAPDRFQGENLTDWPLEAHLNYS